MADTIMLSVLSGLKEVGVFTTMVFLSNALFVPYVSVIKTAAPNVPRLWKKKDMVGLTELYKKVSSIGYFVTFTLFSLVWFNIDFALSYLPEDYSGGKYIFLLLMIGRMFDALGGINGDILLTSKKFKIEIWLTVPLMLMVFFFNYFLIPTYGGLGAAIVTAGVYILYNVLRVFFNVYFFKLFPYDRQFLKLFALSIVMFSLGALADYFLKGILHFLIVTIIPLVFFVLPVYKLNLIPEINEFIHQILIKVKLKNAN
jgi:O-antigen/teichoic acid export membrane protein